MNPFKSVSWRFGRCAPRRVCDVANAVFSLRARVLWFGSFQLVICKGGIVVFLLQLASGLGITSIGLHELCIWGPTKLILTFEINQK